MKLRQRWIIRLWARLAAWALRALCSTVRINMNLAVPNTCPYEPTSEHYLYCLWHDSILGVIFGDRAIDMAGLVSHHEDGSYLADAMECVGLTPIRGSSRHGGAAALKQMMQAAERKHIAIATDGPRGPRHVVKEGIIFLASQTGRAILPVGLSATRAWRPRGRWSDLLIPKPFARLVYVVGPPLNIPAAATREEREVWRQRLQDSMDRAFSEANRRAGFDPDPQQSFRRKRAA